MNNDIVKLKIEKVTYGDGSCSYFVNEYINEIPKNCISKNDSLEDAKNSLDHNKKLRLSKKQVSVSTIFEEEL